MKAEKEYEVWLNGRLVKCYVKYAYARKKLVNLCMKHGRSAHVLVIEMNKFQPILTDKYFWPE